MINDNSIINRNAIILARESRRLTQAELSNLLSMKQGTLSKIENGFLPVNDNILESLTKTLKYPKEFFYEDIKISPLNFNIFRKNKSISTKDLDYLNAIINIYKMHFNKLFKNISPEENKIVHYDVDLNTPQEIANFVREYWEISPGPIENMVVLLENAGIFVKYIDYKENGFSGVTSKTENGSYLIFVNRNMPVDRIRFTLAHELGHIIMHEYPTSNMEKEAHEFASEFLMPSLEIRKYITDVSFPTLIQLKRLWKVSMASLLMKARELNLITQRKYQSTWTLFSKYGYRKMEPYSDDIPFEETQFSQDVIQIYLEQLNYSIDELCSLLRLNKDEFYLNYLQESNLNQNYKPLNLI